MKKKINIYYHVCLVNNGTSIALEQLHQLALSGLMYEADSINIGIKYDDNSPDNRDYFLNIIEQYNIKSNINILYSKHNSRNNDREVSTIAYFKKYADSLPDDTNSYILYFHTKGVAWHGSDHEIPVRYWRHYLEYFTIMNWKDCISKLDEGYESCGTFYYPMKVMNESKRVSNPTNNELIYYPGSFYWLNTSLIKRIPERYFDINNEYQYHSVEALPGIEPHKYFSFDGMGTYNKIDPYKSIVYPMDYIK